MPLEFQYAYRPAKPKPGQIQQQPSNVAGTSRKPTRKRVDRVTGGLARRKQK